MSIRSAVLGSLAFLAACSATPLLAQSTLPAGARYVAMGSSYAAGPGLPPAKPGEADRCTRSAANYAHLVAARLKLDLVDQSCSGATTAHILGPWRELPPQMSAVTPDTKLVTITIGGNDVDYMGVLFALACAATRPGDAGCPPVPKPSEATWQADERAMHAIVAGIRQRAPAARIIFVDYVTVLPEKQGCAAIPFSPAQIADGRAVAGRLARMTAQVAASEGVELLPASALSRDHDACAATPWANGWIANRSSGGPAPFHPNAAGMAGIAKALEAMLAHPAKG